MADSTTAQEVLALLQSESSLNRTHGIELLTSSLLANGAPHLGNDGAVMVAITALTRAPDLPHVERVLACQSMGRLLLTPDNLLIEGGHQGLQALSQLLTGPQALQPFLVLNARSYAVTISTTRLETLHFVWNGSE